MIHNFFFGPVKKVSQNFFFWSSKKKMIFFHESIDYIDPRGKNYFELSYLFISETISFNHCYKWGLLGDDTECDLCGNTYKLIYDSTLETGARLLCPFCNIKKSIYHNTIFSFGKLQTSTVLKLLYFWSQQESIDRTSFETAVSKPTVINYFQAFRDSCLEYVDHQPKIGGVGFIVQIDETQYVKRKNEVGRILPNSDIWIFGGICVNTNKIFATPVDDRSAGTLLPLIQEHILPGTTIYSDCWAAYNGIRKLPQNYSHYTVNHSENFVDPITGTHTQNIERYWLTMKEMRNRHKGVSRSEVESYVAEAVWRHNEGVKNRNSFIKALELIRQTHYYHK